MTERPATLLRERADRRGGPAPAALPLGASPEPLVAHPAPAGAQEVEPLEPERALVATDFRPSGGRVFDSLIRLAYRAGVPGQVLAAPLRKPSRLRLLATVASPLAGDRAQGMALRTGALLVHGARFALADIAMGPHAHLCAPLARAVHGFGWLRDLAACGPREQGAGAAEPILAAWLAANPDPGKGAAWSVELTGLRLMAWLVHAPLILGGSEALRTRALAAIEAHARWLDRHVARGDDTLGEVAGWCAIAAAGLLLPEGRPRRLHGEAGLLRALGELVSDDGGVLSRSPSAQMEAIALLVDLRACYAAAGREPPAALETILAMMVPPLLALRMGDGGLASWQGAGAISAPRLAALVEASGVRVRPQRAPRAWGYHRLAAGKAVLVMDAAPPPRARNARTGCASTLAFEFSHDAQRIVVSCGGAEYAGALVPARIEQGLRGTAAHSTLVLDETNSTAVLLGGKLGKGVEEVDVVRGDMAQGARKAQRIEASHKGYALRHGLVHGRILMLAGDGCELRGEDLLEPATKKGQRGKIAFAIRFHLAPGIEVGLAEDRLGAGLALPDGSYWQFRLAAASGEAALALEDSLWVDGQGRVRANRQLVAEGMAARSGGRFPWLLKRMG